MYLHVPLCIRPSSGLLTSMEALGNELRYSARAISAFNHRAHPSKPHI